MVGRRPTRRLARWRDARASLTHLQIGTVKRRVGRPAVGTHEYTAGTSSASAAISPVTSSMDLSIIGEQIPRHSERQQPNPIWYETSEDDRRKAESLERLHDATRRLEAIQRDMDRHDAEQAKRERALPSCWADNRPFSLFAPEGSRPRSGAVPA